MVFSKRRTATKQYKIYGLPVEKVDEFCYLGVIFRYNGSFLASIKHNVSKAKKALFCLYKTMIKYDLTVENTLELYDRLILPILLYGCEVWGFENLDQIEIFHRKFLRKVLAVQSRTPNCMVYGELGCTELKFTVWRRMISFWINLYGRKSKYSYVFSELMLKLSNHVKFKWINSVKSILNHSGIPCAYMYPDLCKPTELNNYLKIYYTDLSKQLWRTEMRENRLCSSYIQHKFEPTRENYLSALGFKTRKAFATFRCAHTNFPLVRGLYAKETTTVCPLCDSECIPDQYHLLLTCEKFTYARAEFLPRHLYTDPSLTKFNTLMNSQSDILHSVVNLCDFILSFF